MLTTHHDPLTIHSHVSAGVSGDVRGCPGVSGGVRGCPGGDIEERWVFFVQSILETMLRATKPSRGDVRADMGRTLM